MARIAGVDLPRDKRVEIGLTYIYGIGRTSSNRILAEAGVNPDIRCRDLTDEDVKKMSQKELKHMLKERASKAYEVKEAEFPEPEHIREIERVVLLKVIDAKWMAHIDDMDQLRQGIGLQAYGNRDPKV